MRTKKRRFHQRGIMLSLILLEVWLGWLLFPAQAQDGWQIGEVVGLQRGVCIREGPGFSYRAHTRVPENDWLVKVIDGPRQADGLIWYDTSRRAAGDPSGGTGWVAFSQSDRNCPEAGPRPAPPPPAIPAPPSSAMTFLERLVGLVQSLLPQGWMQWAWWVLILAAVLWLWRKIAFPFFTILYLAFVGFALWLLMSFTRSWWEPLWLELAGPTAPDPATLAALLPFVSWLVTRISRR